MSPLPRVVLSSERAEHEQHKRHSSNEHKSKYAADGPGPSRQERAVHPLLAEGTQSGGKSGVISGKIPLHLLQDALLELFPRATSRSLVPSTVGTHRI